MKHDGTSLILVEIDQKEENQKYSKVSVREIALLGESRNGYFLYLKCHSGICFGIESIFGGV